MPQSCSLQEQLQQLQAQLAQERTARVAADSKVQRLQAQLGTTKPQIPRQLIAQFRGQLQRLQQHTTKSDSTSSGSASSGRAAREDEAVTGTTLQNSHNSYAAQYKQAIRHSNKSLDKVAASAAGAASDNDCTGVAGRDQLTSKTSKGPRQESPSPASSATLTSATTAQGAHALGQLAAAAAAAASLQSPNSSYCKPSLQDASNKDVAFSHSSDPLQSSNIQVAAQPAQGIHDCQPTQAMAPLAAQGSDTTPCSAAASMQQAQRGSSKVNTASSSNGPVIRSTDAHSPAQEQGNAAQDCSRSSADAAAALLRAARSVSSSVSSSTSGYTEPPSGELGVYNSLYSVAGFTVPIPVPGQGDVHITPSHSCSSMTGATDISDNEAMPLHHAEDPCNSQGLMAEFASTQHADVSSTRLITQSETIQAWQDDSLGSTAQPDGHASCGTASGPTAASSRWRSSGAQGICLPIPQPHMLAGPSTSQPSMGSHRSTQHKVISILPLTKGSRACSQQNEPVLKHNAMSEEAVSRPPQPAIAAAGGSSNQAPAGQEHTQWRVHEQDEISPQQAATSCGSCSPASSISLSGAAVTPSGRGSQHARTTPSNEHPGAASALLTKAAGRLSGGLQGSSLKWPLAHSSQQPYPASSAHSCVGTGSSRLGVPSGSSSAQHAEIHGEDTTPVSHGQMLLTTLAQPSNHVEQQQQQGPGLAHSWAMSEDSIFSLTASMASPGMISDITSKGAVAYMDQATPISQQATTSDSQERQCGALTPQNEQHPCSTGAPCSSNTQQQAGQQELMQRNRRGNRPTGRLTSSSDLTRSATTRSTGACAVKYPPAGPPPVSRTSQQLRDSSHLRSGARKSRPVALRASVNGPPYAGQRCNQASHQRRKEGRERLSIQDGLMNAASHLEGGGSNYSALPIPGAICTAPSSRILRPPAPAGSNGKAASQASRRESSRSVGQQEEPSTASNVSIDDPGACHMQAHTSSCAQLTPGARADAQSAEVSQTADAVPSALDAPQPAVSSPLLPQADITPCSTRPAAARHAPPLTVPKSASTFGGTGHPAILRHQLQELRAELREQRDEEEVNNSLLSQELTRRLQVEEGQRAQLSSLQQQLGQQEFQMAQLEAINEELAADVQAHSLHVTQLELLLTRVYHQLRNLAHRKQTAQVELQNSSTVVCTMGSKQGKASSHSPAADGLRASEPCPASALQQHPQRRLRRMSIGYVSNSDSPLAFHMSHSVCSNTQERADAGDPVSVLGVPGAGFNMDDTVALTRDDGVHSLETKVEEVLGVLTKEMAANRAYTAQAEAALKAAQQRIISLQDSAQQRHDSSCSRGSDSVTSGRVRTCDLEAAVDQSSEHPAQLLLHQLQHKDELVTALQAQVSAQEFTMQELQARCEGAEQAWGDCGQQLQACRVQAAQHVSELQAKVRELEARHLHTLDLLNRAEARAMFSQASDLGCGAPRQLFASQQQLSPQQASPIYGSLACWPTPCSEQGSISCSPLPQRSPGSIRDHSNPDVCVQGASHTGSPMAGEGVGGTACNTDCMQPPSHTPASKLSPLALWADSPTPSQPATEVGIMTEPAAHHHHAAAWGSPLSVDASGLHLGVDSQYAGSPAAYAGVHPTTQGMAPVPVTPTSILPFPTLASQQAASGAVQQQQEGAGTMRPGASSPSPLYFGPPPASCRHMTSAVMHSQSAVQASIDALDGDEYPSSSHRSSRRSMHASTVRSSRVSWTCSRSVANSGASVKGVRVQPAHTPVRSRLAQRWHASQN